MHYEDTIKSGRDDIIVIETQCSNRHTATHAIVSHEANKHTRVFRRPYGHTAVTAA